MAKIRAKSQKDSTNPQYLSINEAAYRLGVRHTLVRRLFRGGELRGFRVASSTRILASSVDEFIEANSNWIEFEKGEKTPALGKSS